MAKWDIKDGFWQLDCNAGKEWNFACVLLSSHASYNVMLVVPTSCQMGWIESQRDVAAQYVELAVNGMPVHWFH